MGLGRYYVTSPRMCFSTEDYNGWMNERYQKNDDDDQKTNPTWIYLPYCEECEKYRESSNNICSHDRSHTILVSCNYCQNNFKTFNDKEVRCSFCCRLIECKLKT